MKLRTVTYIPIISLFSLSFIAFIFLRSGNDTLEKLSNTYNQANTLFLEADRDLYQAIQGENLALLAEYGTELHKQALSLHLENLSQSSKRINDAFNLLEEQEFVSLRTSYIEKRKIWEANTNQVIKLASNDSTKKMALALSLGESEKSFNELREIINKSEEKIQSIISEYTQSHIFQSKIIIGVFVNIALLVTIILLYITRKFIKKINLMVDTARAIAKGDISSLM